MNFYHTQVGTDEWLALENEKKDWEERCRKLMSYIANSTKVYILYYQLVYTICMFLFMLYSRL